MCTQAAASQQLAQSKKIDQSHAIKRLDNTKMGNNNNIYGYTQMKMGVVGKEGNVEIIHMSRPRR